MTLTVSPLVVIGVLWLALFGVVFLWRAARSAARAGWAWLRRDRVGEALEDDGPEESGLCAGCWDDSEHCDGAYDLCNCTCGWPEDWAERELPPERSWEELTGHPRQERRLEPWEADIWAAYAAVGLDGTGFTRAMAASVRELVR